MQIDLNQDPILNQQINDVEQTTLKYAGTKYYKAIIFYFVIAGAWLIAGLYFWLFKQSTDLLVGLAYFAIIPFIFFKYLADKVEGVFMQQFANSNNYQYSPFGPLESQTGYIFSRGHSRSIDDYITGKYLNCPIELFIFTYKEGFGRDERTYHNTIFSLDFQDPIPHITLIPASSMDSVSGEKLKLEGDFDKHFSLYAQKGFELETLQIFTPDFMAKVENWKFGLEFIGTKLYVYAANEISRRTDLLNMYEAVKYLASRLDPLIEKMKSDITAVMDTQK